MAIASALPSLLTATAAPAVPWLSLNVTIVDNDRGASPSSYRARALGAGAQEVPPGTVHVIKQCFSVKMWPCQASFWSRWHDPVLGRWLGLTPEQPAHFLRGFPECPRAAPSRVGDPPGLGRRGGAQGAARGAIREKRYNLPDPGVQHTSYLEKSHMDKVSPINTQQRTREQPHHISGTVNARRGHHQRTA